MKNKVQRNDGGREFEGQEQQEAAMQAQAATEATQEAAPANTDSTYSPAERELLADVVRALRGLRYGTVTLTVHEGRLVEIQKTERIRRDTAKPKV
jgi:hypothetical protein